MQATGYRITSTTPTGEVDVTDGIESLSDANDLADAADHLGHTNVELQVVLDDNTTRTLPR